MAVAKHLAPAWFVLALAPGYYLLYRRGVRAGAAVYATALFFAAIHAGAWPHPVPLFVLGLGLGWLAQRTRSLVGPVVMHALFNGVACVWLLAGGPSNADAERLARDRVAGLQVEPHRQIDGQPQR
jgi:hypothetical protein